MVVEKRRTCHPSFYKVVQKATWQNGRWRLGNWRDQGGGRRYREESFRVREGRLDFKLKERVFFATVEDAVKIDRRSSGAGGVVLSSMH